MNQKCNRLKEDGSITVEATLMLPLFMFAFMAIVWLAMIARVECITQYAIDQTAKEISQYCYIADKAGFLKNNMSKDSCIINSTDDAIDGIIKLQQMVDSGVTDMADSYNSGDIEGMISGAQNNVGSIKSQGEAIYSKIKDIAGDNPVGAVKTLATALAGETAKDVVSRVVAIPLCKALVPKYITNNTSDADAVLKKLGVEEGINGLNFGMSTVLKDGRTINVVCIYKVKVFWLLGGEKYINVKQTASTAAWIKSASLDEAQVAEQQRTGSNWSSGNYGHLFVNQEKDNAGSNAVKSGIGIDMYNQETNTFTEVHSMNIFNKSYANHTGNGDSADQYTIKKSSVKSAIKSYANGMVSNVNKAGEEIIMEDGTRMQTAREDLQHRNKELIIYVPEETQGVSENKKTMDEIAQEVQGETGVKVIIKYKDKAFTD